jgi:hypothetical protein
MTAPTYTPSTLPAGGNTISTSSLDCWDTCPWLWFLTYLAPPPDGTNGDPTEGQGLSWPWTALPLFIGGLWHDILYWFRAEGPDTALEHGRTYWEKRKHELQDPFDAEGAWEIVARAFPNYLEKVQWEDFTVLNDGEGRPLLERTFAIPLRGGKWLYEVKPDAIGLQDGRTMVREYKTTTTNWLSRAVEQVKSSTQVYGELLVLHTLFPEASLGGVQFEFATPAPVTKGNDALMVYKLSVERKLDVMEASITNWKDLVSQGADPYEAGWSLFPMSGMGNGLCSRFGRDCEFASYCQNVDLGMRALQGMVPRRPSPKRNPDTGEVQ